MKDHEPVIGRFFEAYAARMNAALESPPRVDVSAAVSAFARYFVGSGPAGPTGGRNGWFLRFTIRAAMPSIAKSARSAWKYEACA